MSSKSTFALNVVWAAVAAGAFFIGKNATSGGPSKSANARAESRMESAGKASIAGLNAAPAPGPSGAGTGADAAGAGTLTAENAERRAAAALADLDPLRRKSRIAEMLLNLSPESVPGVLAAFESGPRDDETSRHFRDFLYGWGRISGEDAIAYMMDPESPRRDHYGGTSAIAGWAAVDAAAAKEYVAAVENKHGKQWLHYGVFREVLRTDLDDAIVYSEQNERSNARGRQLDALGAAIFERRGLDGLTGWLEGIDHGKEGNDLLAYKQYATSMVLDKMAASDPELASQWIAEHAGEPYLTSDGLERAARRAAGPINEELDWLAKLPGEIGGQRYAIGERFEDYIREDFAAAGEWLAAQPLGPAYDEAIQDYAMSAAKDDREAALAWVERISDPKIREETMRRVAPQVRVETKFVEIEQG